MTLPFVWPQIDPGRMVHSITILQQMAASDISGTTNVWTPFITTKAEIVPVSGLDVIRSGQEITQTYVTVKIRWQPGILPNMRVQSQNGTYSIQWIENPGERNIILILTCKGLGPNE